MPWNTPSNFITHADDLQLQSPLSEAVWPDHALDLFVHEGQEYLVTLCNDDQLRQIAADSTLPREVKNEVACHRVSSPNLTNLRASEYYFLDVRTLDTDEGEKGQRMARMSGMLYSPQGACGQGELVLRVSELLYALCQSAEKPFRYANSCFYPLLLPGDPEDAVRKGKGWILAYPVPPVELRNLYFSNEEWLKQAFFECLTTIQNDLKEVKPKAPFSLRTLPVPSRAMLMAELKQQGYKIVQDKAIATANSGSLAGRMLKIFGNLTGQGFTLPPEATVEDYLKLGRETLQAEFETVPFRMKAFLYTPPPTPAPPPSPLMTMNTSPIIPRTPAPPEPVPQLPPTPKQDWMSDFGSSSAPSRPGHSAPPPRPKPAPPPPKPSGKPDWAKDFE